MYLSVLGTFFIYICYFHPKVDNVISICKLCVSYVCIKFKQTPFFDILVPTIDTKRYGFLMERLLDVGHSVLFTGTTGVGKVLCTYICIIHDIESILTCTC